MVRPVNLQQFLPAFMLSPEIQANPFIGLQQFFNGESIEQIRTELEKLKETTVTESYGELEKEDKWFMMDFFRRINNLVEVAYLMDFNYKNNQA